jgi:outer membrane protein assembly factor BamB
MNAWKTMHKITTVSIILASFASQAATEPLSITKKPKWTIGNLDQPESAIASIDGKFIYISNINGQPTELNGKGYISRASIDGDMLDQHWVKGLDAPKGLAISGQSLYVADMKNLVEINIKTGKIVNVYKAPNAKMLNDVTVTEDGNVYVSDLLEGTIHRLSQSKFEPWFKSTALPHPNGLYSHQGELLVASWGKGMNSDFSTATPGDLYRLDLNIQNLTPVATGYHLGNLDGVVAVKDAIYVSDWITGELFQLKGKERKRVLTLKPGLADIGATQDMLLAPMMMDNELSAWKLSDF